MAIDTTYLDADTDKVKPARAALLEMARRVNAMPISVFDKMSSAQIADVQAYAGSIDVSAAVQEAIDEGYRVLFPAGRYRIDTPPSVPSQRILEGEGIASTQVVGYGCDAFAIAGTSGNYIVFRDMSIISVSALGADDPKTHTGINCVGTASDHVNFIGVQRCYFRGWNRCVDWRYAWNSVIDDCTTLNCNYGLRLFGQSVNNSVSNSRLGVNTGTASIDLAADGATIGEGLMVTNTLMAEGQYGVTSNNGFLALQIDNCILDLIANVGINGVDPRSLAVSNSWIYAANKGIRFSALGAPVTTKASISNCHITTTDSGGVGVEIGNGNSGISISGGSIECGTNSRAIFADTAAQSVSVDGVHFVNGGALASMCFAGASGHKFGTNNTGAATVQWTGGKPASQEAAAWISFTGAGASLKAYNASISRSAAGTYLLTFTTPLSDANYAIVATARTAGATEVQVRPFGPGTTNCTIYVTDGAGALFDPEAVHIVVYD